MPPSEVTARDKALVPHPDSVSRVFPSGKMQFLRKPLVSYHQDSMSQANNVGRLRRRGEEGGSWRHQFKFGDPEKPKLRGWPQSNGISPFSSLPKPNPAQISRSAQNDGPRGPNNMIYQHGDQILLPSAMCLKDGPLTVPVVPLEVAPIAKLGARHLNKV